MKQRDIREDEDQISIFDILYPERKKNSSKVIEENQNGKDRTTKKGNRTSEE